MIRPPLSATLPLTACALALLPAHAHAMEGVVASIKPVHSLVAGVMEGVGEPRLLIGGASSPHSYAMRPSDAEALQEARIVFWIGDGLETFLVDTLDDLAPDAAHIALEDIDGLTLLSYREGGAFEEHDHAEGADTHGHDDEEHVDDDEHAHDGADPHHDEEADGDHEHEEVAHQHEEGEDHAGHDHSEYDMHVWLDPENAKAMIGAIETALADADPDNADAYAANAETMRADLDALSAEIGDKLAPLADRPFVVFHDAYQYFETRFGLEAAGAITINPEVDPGAERVAEMQETVRALDAACVFSEPQFEPRIVDVVAEGSNAASGVLDPLGAELEDGPELYFDLMRTMAMSFATCLDGES